MLDDDCYCCKRRWWIGYLEGDDDYCNDAAASAVDSFDLDNRECSGGSDESKN